MDVKVVLGGAAAVGAVGYALAVWLSRATVRAERLEEQQYCGEPVAPPAVQA